MTTPSTDPGSLESTAPRSAEEIEVEIEQTRERLVDSLNALGQRLSPRRRLQAAATSARRTGETFFRTAADSLTPDITTMIRMDHSHVLALFRRFRPFATDGKKKALVTNACLALEIHAQLEEEIFYPALRVAMGRPGDVLDKSVSEHDEMRGLIVTLRSMEPFDASYDETFRTLMRVVLHHVADEETTILPRAEEVMRDDLAALGLQMTKRRLELLKPHAREVARTTARSFPLAVTTAVAGTLILGWLAFRPRRPH